MSIPAIIIPDGVILTLRKLMRSLRKSVLNVRAILISWMSHLPMNRGNGTSDIDINSLTSWKEIILDGYPYNDTLKIISNASMKVKYRNGTYDIYAGENIMYDIELYEGENKLYFQGKGKITIVHRGGML